MNYQYTSIVKSCYPIPDEFLVEFSSMVVELAESYVPPLFEIPMNLGLYWHASWASSSVVHAQSCPIKGLTDLYSRAVWDLFSIALWDKSYLLSPTSDQHKSIIEGRLWPFNYENREWAWRYIEPVYAFFASDGQIFPTRGEMPDDSSGFPWSLYLYITDLDSVYPNSVLSLHSLLERVYSYCCSLLDHMNVWASYLTQDK